MTATFERASVFGERLEQRVPHGLITGPIGEVSAGGGDRGDSQSRPEEDGEEHEVSRAIGADEDGFEPLGGEFLNLTLTHPGWRGRMLLSHGFCP